MQGFSLDEGGLASKVLKKEAFREALAGFGSGGLKRRLSTKQTGRAAGCKINRGGGGGLGRPKT